MATRVQTNSPKPVRRTPAVMPVVKRAVRAMRGTNDGTGRIASAPRDARTASSLYPGLGLDPNEGVEPPPKPRLRLPRKLSGLLTPKRYKVLWGGRGGTKSWGVAKTLLMMAAHSKLRILCVRELQVSIADSVHKLLSDQIRECPWLSSKYDIQKTTIVCHVTGSEFLFSGIKNNPKKVKSTEGVDICWVEEAENVSDVSWNILIPTIRKPGSEIWVTFNPDLETDPTSKRFLKKPPPNSWIQKVGWEDNPWLPQELRDEKDYLYMVDPEAAAHVWGGGYRTNSAAQIFRGKYRVESFVPEHDWDGPYWGADWGFSVDPTTLVKCYIHDNTLYIEREAYAVGCDIDDTPELFDAIPGARKATIRADCARPETISYMNRHQYGGVRPCSKWTGSVEDGIAFLRSFKAIVIHTRCKHTLEEAQLYSYKVDRLSKDVTTDIEDKHNHIWDAVRYALEPLIKQSGLGMLNYLKQLKSEQDANRKGA